MRAGSSLTCVFTDSTIDSFYGPFKEPNGAPLSTTSLVGIIFLCSCVVLVCAFTFIWFGALYYRQYKRNRREKKQRKALETAMQQMLDKSPILIYEENSDNEFTDKDPTCAVCLETFKNKERIRKIGKFFPNLLYFY